jgi:hypothetical protein
VSDNMSSIFHAFVSVLINKLAFVLSIGVGGGDGCSSGASLVKSAGIWIVGLVRRIEQFLKCSSNLVE